MAAVQVDPQVPPSSSLSSHKAKDFYVSVLHFFRRGSVLWVVLCFFFLGFVPGAWIPNAAVLLKSLGYGWVLKYVFLPIGLTTILAPLVFGALADNRYPANRIMIVVSALVTFFVWFGFRTLAWDWGIGWFLLSITLYGLSIAPAWALSSVVGLACLKNPDKHYALLRIGATFGWSIAGVFAGSFLKLTHSADIGNLSACAGVLLVGTCFMLPHVPPQVGELTTVTGVAKWKRALGLDALSLLKDNDQRVFFITAGLSAMPLASIYMHSPLHLETLGDESPATTLALGQVSEVFAMIFIGALLTKTRVKVVLGIALIAGLLRFVLFALAGEFDMKSLIVIGIPLHGVVFGFWYVTGQIFLERRVENSMRAQAQSLLNVIYAGIGGFFGTILTDEWYQYAVEGKGNWGLYWWGLCGVLAVITLYFYMFYQSKGAASESVPDGDK